MRVLLALASLPLLAHGGAADRTETEARAAAGPMVGAAAAAGASAAANGTEGAALRSSSSARCGSAEAPLNSRCTGCPPTLDGKLCASTTWYEDRTKGSCGCGTSAGTVEEDYWTLTKFTAAINTASIDPVNPGLGWCPSGCGQCYELCSTGGAVNTQDLHAEAGRCEVFKITNRCADGWTEDTPDWCSQKLSFQECQADPAACQQQRSTNMFGYSAHFDLQDAHRQIQHGLGWQNVEVTFEPVSCDRWDGPKDIKCAGCSR